MIRILSDSVEHSGDTEFIERQLANFGIADVVGDSPDELDAARMRLSTLTDSRPVLRQQNISDGFVCV